MKVLGFKPYTLYHEFLPEIGYRQRTRIEVPDESLNNYDSSRHSKTTKKNRQS